GQAPLYRDFPTFARCDRCGKVGYKNRKGVFIK
ncbi:unnamed protein product, partial [marine sediment metagenome]